MSVRLVCVFLFLLCFGGSLANGSIIFPCVTPNAEQAYCMSLFQCPILMKSLSTLDPSAIAFVKESICLGCRAGDFMVCCGTASNFVQLNNCTVDLNLNNQAVKNSTNTDKINSNTVVNNIKDTGTNTDSIEAHREHVKRNLLPSSIICGQQHNDDRFILNNNNSTAIDEFPWLVHLKLSFMEYEEEFGDRCNGVLISKRYILTDAYCGYEAVRAIMGQYTTGQKVSCTDDTNEECTEPVIEHQLHSKVRSGKKSNGPIDLTLIRLNKTVQFSDFVRPICLPVDGSKREQDTLTFSGWGASDSGAIKKKRLVYNVVQPEVCYSNNVGQEGNAKFANATVVCLEPPPGNTDQACNGDRGGPFMYSYKHRWYTDGIAFEVNGDGNPGSCNSAFTISGYQITPSVMNWILDNMHD